MVRADGRLPDELRPLTITAGYLPHAEGSALIELGKTVVVCAVTMEDRVPPFLRGSGRGWVTAEYGMLPRSTLTRTPRDRSATSGRTHEIQRLIGRSLRAVSRLELLGERTFIIDCDVIQADGGTRGAAITGAYVALRQAFERRASPRFSDFPLRTNVAAVSVGLVEQMPLLDLNYEEDSRADVDFNIVMTGEGELAEVQGSAERRCFSHAAMNELLDLAEAGIRSLFDQQAQALGAVKL